MPELPEVETVRRGLERTVKGKTIRAVQLRRADLRVPFPAGFAEALSGATVEGVSRRAKYLLFSLDNGRTLVAHLGMSGRFSTHGEMPGLKAHDHAVFSFEGGGVLVFNDARRFGLMTLAETRKIALHPLFKDLGPEPLSGDFSAAYLKEQLARRKGPVKPVLMDQKLVVGVGNIYASEALFSVGIDPRTPASKAAARAGELVTAIQGVLEAAIASGGSSLRDFFDADGAAGYFQHRFRVYGREEEPCTTCGAPIRRIAQAGRSTFYCARCQKVPSP